MLNPADSMLAFGNGELPGVFGTGGRSENGTDDGGKPRWSGDR